MTPEMIAEILETVMILAFGLSWPLSIYKSVKSRISIHALRVEGDIKNGQSFRLFLRKREKNLPL